MPMTSIPRALLVILLGCAVTAVSAAEIHVRLDRQRLDLGEVLELQLSAEGDTDQDPDFSPLTQDFDILGRGQSQVTSIINGKISHTRQWNLQLAPKRVGQLRIPAIAVGKDRSEPVTVNVVEQGAGGATATAGAEPKPLFVRAEVANSAPYVQQATDYRVKVYFRQQPQRAVLSEPQAEGATLQQVGEDRGYDESVDGVAYRVIERRYRLTPQRSGRISIQAPRLEAMLEDPNQADRRDPFADLDQAFGGRLFQGFPTLPGITHPGRRVVERAPEIDLEVRPQPAGAGSAWLPATSVQIADEWTPSPPVFRVGEPVTRSLTITATGTTAAQLPNLDLGSIAGAQVYPDQPRGEDLATGADPSATKSFKIAVIPNRAGRLILPEIRLPWWDTLADQPRVAVVPARTVEVAPASGSASQSQPVEPPVAAPPETRSTPQAANSSAVATLGGRADIWPWVSVALGAGWILTLLWRRGERRSRLKPAGAPEQVASAGSGSLASARREVERACLSNDPRAARASLITWARIRWPNLATQGLEALRIQVGDEAFGATLRAIDRAIYAPPGENWDGAMGWKTLAPFIDGFTASAEGAEVDPIPDLYPKV